MNEKPDIIILIITKSKIRSECYIMYHAYCICKSGITWLDFFLEKMVLICTSNLQKQQKNKRQQKDN